MSDRAEQLDEVAAALGPLAARSAPLGPLCTYRVGGPAAVLATVGTVADLAAVAAGIAGTGLPLLVIGKGSNLLVADAGFDGVVVHLGDGFDDVTINRDSDGDDHDGGSVTVRLGGGVLLPVAARRTAAESLTGFEWAVGVPGSVGGAVRMNAGGHGSDMAACLVRAEVFDLLDGGGSPVWWVLDELQFGYRHSALAEHQVVVSAELGLTPGDRATSEAEISNIVRWRRANQPGGQNAGSVFTNPPGDSAGRLIDTAGLKGLRVGTAEVSTKHANFIQAGADGSADDVWRLIGEVRRRVADRYGIVLHCENRLVGFDGVDSDNGLDWEAP